MVQTREDFVSTFDPIRKTVGVPSGERPVGDAAGQRGLHFIGTQVREETQRRREGELASSAAKNLALVNGGAAARHLEHSVETEEQRQLATEKQVSHAELPGLAVGLRR